MNIHLLLLKKLVELAPESQYSSYYATLAYLDRFIIWERVPKSLYIKGMVKDLVWEAIPEYLAPIYVRLFAPEYGKNMHVAPEYLPANLQPLPARRLRWLGHGFVRCASRSELAGYNDLFAEPNGILLLSIKLIGTSTIPLNLNINGANFSEIILNKAATIMAKGPADEDEMAVITLSWAYLIVNDEKRPFGNLFNQLVIYQTQSHHIDTYPTMAQASMLFSELLEYQNSFNSAIYAN